MAAHDSFSTGAAGASYFFEHLAAQHQQHHDPDGAFAVVQAMQLQRPDEVEVVSSMQFQAPGTTDLHHVHLAHHAQHLPMMQPQHLQHLQPLQQQQQQPQQHHDSLGQQQHSPLLQPLHHPQHHHAQHHQHHHVLFSHEPPLPPPSSETIAPTTTAATSSPSKNPVVPSHHHHHHHHHQSMLLDPAFAFTPPPAGSSDGAGASGSAIQHQHTTIDEQAYFAAVAGEHVDAMSTEPSPTSQPLPTATTTTPVSQLSSELPLPQLPQPSLSDDHQYDANSLLNQPPQPSQEGQPVESSLSTEVSSQSLQSKPPDAATTTTTTPTTTTTSTSTPMITDLPTSESASSIVGAVPNSPVDRASQPAHDDNELREREGDAFNMVIPPETTATASKTRSSRQHTPISHEWAEKCLAAIEAGECSSIREFVKENPDCSVPRTTLTRCVSRLRSGATLKKVGRKRTLNTEEEEELIRMCRAEPVLTNQLIIEHAIQVAGMRSGDTSPDMRVRRIGGKDWLRSFKERANLTITKRTIRTPSPRTGTRSRAPAASQSSTSTTMVTRAKAAASSAATPPPLPSTTTTTTATTTTTPATPATKSEAPDSPSHTTASLTTTTSSDGSSSSSTSTSASSSSSSSSSSGSSLLSSNDDISQLLEPNITNTPTAPETIPQSELDMILAPWSTTASEEPTDAMSISATTDATTTPAAAADPVLPSTTTTATSTNSLPTEAAPSQTTASASSATAMVVEDGSSAASPSAPETRSRTRSRRLAASGSTDIQAVDATATPSDGAPVQQPSQAEAADALLQLQLFTVSKGRAAAARATLANAPAATTAAKRPGDSSDMEDAARVQPLTTACSTTAPTEAPSPKPSTDVPATVATAATAATATTAATASSNPGSTAATLTTSVTLVSAESLQPEEMD